MYRLLPSIQSRRVLNKVFTHWKNGAASSESLSKSAHAVIGQDVDVAVRLVANDLLVRDPSSRYCLPPSAV
jgi:hypothetical protein